MGAKLFFITSVLFLLVVSVYSTGDIEAGSVMREAAALSLTQNTNIPEQDTGIAEQDNVIPPADSPEDIPRRHRRILQPVNAYPTEQAPRVVMVQQETSVEDNPEELVKTIYSQNGKLRALFNLFGDEYRQQYNEWVSDGMTSTELEDNVNEMLSNDFNEIYGEDLILHISVGCGS